MTVETVECPRCGRVAVLDPDTPPFCRQCDSPLMWQPPRTTAAVPPEDEQAARAARAAQVVVMLDAPRMEQGCAQCGYHSRVRRDFCEACASPLRLGPVRQRQVWIEPVTEEGAGARKKRIALQIAVMVVAVLLVIGLVLAIWLIFFRSSAWQTSTLDIGNASWDISATQLDDRPVISYVDSGNQAVRVLACAATDCVARESNEIANSLGGSGQGHGTGIAITEAGFPIVSFREGDVGALAVVACEDLACPDATPVAVDPRADAEPDATRDAGYDSSVIIGADGLPLISYWDRGTHTLMAAHCVNVACTAATTARLAAPSGAVDEDTPSGGSTAVALGQSTPMIAFRNENPTRLDLLSCTDRTCTAGKVVTLVPRVDQRDSSALVPGYENAIVVDAQGLPIVAYHDRSDDGIYVVRCLDEGCASVVRNSIDVGTDEFHSEPSIALLNGNPVVAYRATPRGDESGRRLLKVVRCRDVSCGNTSEPETVDGAPPGRLERTWNVLSRKPAELVGRVGYSPTVLVTSTGRIVIAYGDATTGSLKLAVSR